MYIPATGPAGFTLGQGKIPFGFGKFSSGGKSKGTSDAPHRVVLTRPFCIDATEVTVAAYRACVERRVCTVPKLVDEWSTYVKAPTLPINDVSWSQAKVFCESVGKALPSEAQWVWAATGGDGRKYPWGDEAPSCERADFSPGPIQGPAGDFGCHGGGPSPVGSHPLGDRIWPGGRVHDLAGNVWEWTLDTYHPFRAEDATDPVQTQPSGTRVIRGGGWNRSGAGISASFRGGAIVTYQVPGLGFRCVRGLPPQAHPSD